MPESNWRAQLAYDRNGEIKRTMANATVILRNTWTNLVFDEFTGDARMLGEPPPMSEDIKPKAPLVGVWRNGYTNVAVNYLEKNYKLSLAPQYVRQAVDTAARGRPVHPVRDWFESLTWDGKPRLDDWMVTHAGVAMSPHATVVFSKWLISSIARIYKPGCQADHVLILEGEQGVGKSSFFRILGGDEVFEQRWYTELHGDLGSTNAIQSMFQKIIVELPELAALRKTADIERVKAFVTTCTDRIRKPYSIDAEDYPRQCILGGSTNATEWMKEDGRRWWPLRVGQINLQQLREDREQLFAEAVARYKSGEAWHITDETVLASLKDAVESRREVDEWEPMVEKWLRVNGRSEVTISDLLQQLCGQLPGQSTRGEQMRMGQVLTALKWRRLRKQVNGVQKWLYTAPEGWHRTVVEPAAVVVEGPWGKQSQ